MLKLSDINFIDLKLLTTIAACFSIAFTGLLLLYYSNPDVVAYMLRDRAEWGGQPFYLGAISQVGIMTWGTGAAIALFTAAVVRHDDQHRDRQALLLCFGLFSLALCLDDTFQVHEVVGPRYIYIGEKAFLLGYAIALCAFLVRFRRLLLEHALLPLGAMAALATSVILDQSGKFWTDQVLLLLLEDGCFKELGILLWTSFLIQQSWIALKHRPAALPTQADSEAGIMLAPSDTKGSIGS